MEWWQGCVGATDKRGIEILDHRELDKAEEAGDPCTDLIAEGAFHVEHKGLPTEKERPEINRDTMGDPKQYIQQNAVTLQRDE
jgi:hypothetical protein